MKKIGILFGQENTYPPAFVDRVNSKDESGIVAESVSINKVIQGEASEYAVIIDRISQDIPFYRSFLKNAALTGTAVINNPFWWSADEKFFNNAIATQINVAVPKTVLLPSHTHPPDTNELSMRNLEYPLDWDGIFEFVGFPAFFKPFAGGGWKNVYKVKDRAEFFKAYHETGTLVMMLQEAIEFEEYYRCYAIDRCEVRIMRYDPKQPHHLRYVKNPPPVEEKLLRKINEAVIKINNALGYDFNTVEFAVRDDVPYAIDFCNPAPDADIYSVGEENFEWVVEATANMAIRRAKAHQSGANNLTWGDFVQLFVQGEKMRPNRKKNR
jgi:glutathione synthase/RimK-type ligase-like ATP-grasp enzyme